MRGCAPIWRRRTQLPRQLPEGERWLQGVGIDRARCRRRKLERGRHVGNAEHFQVKTGAFVVLSSADAMLEIHGLAEKVSQKIGSPAVIEMLKRMLAQ